VNLIVNSIRWRKGDKVIVTDMEFPTNFYPWIRLRKKGIKVSIIRHKSNGIIDLSDIEKIIDEKTIVLAISHVQYGNGFKIDLKELNRILSGKCLLFVDAIQSLGAIEVDSKFVNFLAAGCHKWLLAPFGTGILYISKKLDLTPAFVGWFSVKSPHSFSLKLEYASSARKFEYGTHNFSGVFGLKAALELLLKVGISNIEKRILQLSNLIIDEVEKLGLKIQTPKDMKKRAGIVNIKIKNPNEVMKKLLKNKIIVSSRIGGIRVSPHFYNNEEDIYKFIQALKKFVRD
jgi:selenocysteine lyase/cysteine desulfurase